MGSIHLVHFQTFSIVHSGYVLCARLLFDFLSCKFLKGYHDFLAHVQLFDVSYWIWMKSCYKELFICSLVSEWFLNLLAYQTSIK